ncbi:MAG TPA: hypothetical protein VGG33_00255, partial [Polyangia bacterium]
MKPRATKRRGGLLTAGVAFAAAALAPQAAEARSSQLFSYAPADVWPTAVRYLRIDRGATLREKDAE